MVRSYLRWQTTTRISEFEDFGLKCTKGIGLFNCTTFGAYLENWIHMPLNANHPAVAETVEPEASENIEGLWPNLRPTLLGGEELIGAIDCELNLQKNPDYVKGYYY